MTENPDIQSIESPPSEEYLRLLMLRDRQINRLSESNVSLSNELRQKEQFIETLQKELAELRQQVLRSRQAQETPGHDETAEETEREASARPRRQRKPREVEAETVRRLRGNKKSASAVCEAALRYWNRLLAAGFVDEHLRLTYRCTNDVAALIVNRLQTQVDPAISWAFFNQYWKITNLQSFLKRPSYKGERLYAEINQIFGLPADAPVFSKSCLNG